MGSAPSYAPVLAPCSESGYHPRAVNARGAKPGEFWRGREVRTACGDDESARAACAMAKRGDVHSAGRNRNAAEPGGGRLHLSFEPGPFFVRGISPQAYAPELAGDKGRPQARAEPRSGSAEGAGLGARAAE